MKRKGAADDDGRPLASNRAASHEFQLLERFEAGIVLTGTEVKSARSGGVSLKEAYAKVQSGEVFLLNAHFTPYEQGNRENGDPRRSRKLLLHAREIRRLDRETQPGACTLVPTKLYLKDGRIKVEIALARGKKSHDKREATKKREAEREINRERGRRA